jgi:hypothetical protein
MLRASCIVLILTFTTLSCSEAAEFNNVVSLGDSLLDDVLGLRSPLVSEHLADRLDADLMELARIGSTSGGLIRQGQHTQAAAEFGAGDLATLWIGGNDFFLSMANPLGVKRGNFRFLDNLEDNVDTILGTLRGAGMEVLIFNLPDMAAVPLSDAITLFDSRLVNVTEATLEWNDRLTDLADEHGAHLVDVYSYFEELSAHPEDFTIMDHELVLGPEYGCEFCVFAEPIHPSKLAQGLIANLAIDVLNDAFPSETPLARVSEAELAELAGISRIGDFLGRWQDAFGLGDGGDFDGDGDTDGRDFLAWQRQPTSVTSGAAVAAVPEPGTICSSLIAAVLLLGPRHGFTKRITIGKS